MFGLCLVLLEHQRVFICFTVCQKGLHLLHVSYKSVNFLCNRQELGGKKQLRDQLLVQSCYLLHSKQNCYFS